MPHDFSDLFRPQVIAVVGASDRYGSAGRKVFARLTAERAAPLVLPVNSRHKTVGACKAYPDLAAACAEHAVDTAVVVLSADKLAPLVREAGRLNIRYLVFVSDIEQPAPATAAKLDKAAEAARKAGVGLFAVPTDGAAALYRRAESCGAGKHAAAYIGQSAGIADCMASYAAERGIAFSRFITLNPRHYPVSTGRLIRLAAAEENNAALLVHISRIDNAAELVGALAEAARRKPVVVLGTLDNEDEEALLMQALRRCHILRVPGLTDFFIAAKLIHTGIIGGGTRLALIANSPQIGALAFKTLGDYGLEAAATGSHTARAFARILPHKPAATNPLYLPADSAPAVFQAAAAACLEDENNDALLLVYVGSGGGDSLLTAQMVSELQAASRKPLLLVWLGSADNDAVRRLFGSRRNLHFRQPESALHALMQLNEYRSHRLRHDRLPQFYDYRAAAQAADSLHKHLKPMIPMAVLPAGRSAAARLTEALRLEKHAARKEPAGGLLLQWEKHPAFGAVMALECDGVRTALLPPPDAVALERALDTLGLEYALWQEWLADALEIFSRLPEIHSCRLRLHRDETRGGIAYSELKLNLQEPDSFSGAANLFAPYPAEEEQQVELAAGSAWLRPVRPEDAELIGRLADGLSAESRYRRFMQRSGSLPPAQLLRLSSFDYRREFALLLTAGDNTPLATAAYNADNDESCEFGILIADGLQGQGIGSLLMEKLIVRARQQGYRRMRAEILSENLPMQKLAAKLGFTLAKHPDDPAMMTAVLTL